MLTGVPNFEGPRGLERVLHTHKHTHTHTHTHTTHPRTCACTHVCMHARMLACTHVCTNTRTHAHMNARTNTPHCTAPRRAASHWIHPPRHAQLRARMHARMHICAGTPTQADRTQKHCHNCSCCLHVIAVSAEVTAQCSTAMPHCLCSRRHAKINTSQLICRWRGRRGKPSVAPAKLR